MDVRLIDANNLGIEKLSKISETTTFVYGWNSALQAVKDKSPTIDPETLPIVQELRAEIDRIKNERDAAKAALHHILMYGLEE